MVFGSLQKANASSIDAKPGVFHFNFGPKPEDFHETIYADQNPNGFYLLNLSKLDPSKSIIMTINNKDGEHIGTLKSHFGNVFLQSTTKHDFYLNDLSNINSFRVAIKGSLESSAPIYCQKLASLSVGGSATLAGIDIDDGTLELQHGRFTLGGYTHAKIIQLHKTQGVTISKDAFFETNALVSSIQVEQKKDDSEMRNFIPVGAVRNLGSMAVDVVSLATSSITNAPGAKADIKSFQLSSGAIFQNHGYFGTDTFMVENCKATNTGEMFVGDIMSMADGTWINGKSATLMVGNLFKVDISSYIDEGQSTFSGIAMVNANSGRLVGKVDVDYGVFRFKESIRAYKRAEFEIGRHLSIRSNQGNTDFDGSILAHHRKKGRRKYSPALQRMTVNMTPGIFLSAHKDVKQSGRILSSNTSVSYSAEKGNFTDKGGHTQSGFFKENSIQISAKDTANLEGYIYSQNHALVSAKLANLNGNRTVKETFKVDAGQSIVQRESDRMSVGTSQLSSTDVSLAGLIRATHGTIIQATEIFNQEITNQIIGGAVQSKAKITKLAGHFHDTTDIVTETEKRTTLASSLKVKAKNMLNKADEVIHEADSNIETSEHLHDEATSKIVVERGSKTNAQVTRLDGDETLDILGEVRSREHTLLSGDCVTIHQSGSVKSGELTQVKSSAGEPKKLTKGFDNYGTMEADYHILRSTHWVQNTGRIYSGKSCLIDTGLSLNWLGGNIVSDGDLSLYADGIHGSFLGSNLTAKNTEINAGIANFNVGSRQAGTNSLTVNAIIANVSFGGMFQSDNFTSNSLLNISEATAIGAFFGVPIQGNWALPSSGKGWWDSNKALYDQQFVRSGLMFGTSMLSGTAKSLARGTQLALSAKDIAQGFYQLYTSSSDDTNDEDLRRPSRFARKFGSSLGLAMSAGRFCNSATGLYNDVYNPKQRPAPQPVPIWDRTKTAFMNSFGPQTTINSIFDFSGAHDTNFTGHLTRQNLYNYDYSRTYGLTKSISAYKGKDLGSFTGYSYTAQAYGDFTVGGTRQLFGGDLFVSAGNLTRDETFHATVGGSYGSGYYKVSFGGNALFESSTHLTVEHGSSTTAAGSVTNKSDGEILFAGQDRGGEQVSVISEENDVTLQTGSSLESAGPVTVSAGKKLTTESNSNVVAGTTANLQGVDDVVHGGHAIANGKQPDEPAPSENKTENESAPASRVGAFVTSKEGNVTLQDGSLMQGTLGDAVASAGGSLISEQGANISGAQRTAAIAYETVTHGGSIDGANGVTILSRENDVNIQEGSSALAGADQVVYVEAQNGNVMIEPKTTLFWASDAKDIDHAPSYVFKGRDITSHGRFAGVQNLHFIARNNLRFGDDAYHSVQGTLEITGDTHLHYPSSITSNGQNLSIKAPNLCDINDLMGQNGRYHNFNFNNIVQVTVPGHVQFNTNQASASRSFILNTDSIGVADNVRLTAPDFLTLHANNGDFTAGAGSYFYAGRLTDIYASGDVIGNHDLTTWNWTSKHTQGNVQSATFKHTTFAGGSGTEYLYKDPATGQEQVIKLGLSVRAQGMVRGTGMIFEAPSSVLVDGVNGIKNEGISVDYLQGYQKDKGNSRTKRTYAYDTMFFEGGIKSTAGKVLLYSAKGDFMQRAGHIWSAQGITADVYGDIFTPELFGVKGYVTKRNSENCFQDLCRVFWDSDKKNWDGLSRTVQETVLNGPIHHIAGGVIRMPGRVLNAPYSHLLEDADKAFLQATPLYHSHKSKGFEWDFEFSLFNKTIDTLRSVGKGIAITLNPFKMHDLYRREGFLTMLQEGPGQAIGATDLWTNIHDAASIIAEKGWKEGWKASAPEASVSCDYVTRRRGWYTNGSGSTLVASAHWSLDEMRMGGGYDYIMLGNHTGHVDQFFQNGQRLDFYNRETRVGTGLKAGGKGIIVDGHFNYDGTKGHYYSPSLFSVGGISMLDVGYWNQDAGIAKIYDAQGSIGSFESRSRQLVTNRKYSHNSVGYNFATGVPSVSINGTPDRIRTRLNPDDPSGLYITRIGSEFTMGSADLTGAHIKIDENQGTTIGPIKNHDLPDELLGQGLGVNISIDDVRNLLPGSSAPIAGAIGTTYHYDGNSYGISVPVSVGGTKPEASSSNQAPSNGFWTGVWDSVQDVHFVVNYDGYTYSGSPSSFVHTLNPESWVQFGQDMSAIGSNTYHHFFPASLDPQYTPVLEPIHSDWSQPMLEDIKERILRNLDGSLSYVTPYPDDICFDLSEGTEDLQLISGESIAPKYSHPFTESFNDVLSSYQDGEQPTGEYQSVDHQKIGALGVFVDALHASEHGHSGFSTAHSSAELPHGGAGSYSSSALPEVGHSVSPQTRFHSLAQGSSPNLPMVRPHTAPVNHMHFVEPLYEPLTYTHNGKTYTFGHRLPGTGIYLEEPVLRFEVGHVLNQMQMSPNGRIQRGYWTLQNIETATLVFADPLIPGGNVGRIGAHTPYKDTLVHGINGTQRLNGDTLLIAGGSWTTPNKMGLGVTFAHEGAGHLVDTFKTDGYFNPAYVKGNSVATMERSNYLLRCFASNAHDLGYCSLTSAPIKHTPPEVRMLFEGSWEYFKDSFINTLTKEGIFLPDSHVSTLLRDMEKGIMNGQSPSARFFKNGAGVTDGVGSAIKAAEHTMCAEISALSAELLYADPYSTVASKIEGALSHLEKSNSIVTNSLHQIPHKVPSHLSRLTNWSHTSSFVRATKTIGAAGLGGLDFAIHAIEAKAHNPSLDWPDAMGQGTLTTAADAAIWGSAASILGGPITLTIGGITLAGSLMEEYPYHHPNLHYGPYNSIESGALQPLGDSIMRPIIRGASQMIGTGAHWLRETGINQTIGIAGAYRVNEMVSEHPEMTRDEAIQEIRGGLEKGLGTVFRKIYEVTSPNALPDIDPYTHYSFPEIQELRESGQWDQMGLGSKRSFVNDLEARLDPWSGMP